MVHRLGLVAGTVLLPGGGAPAGPPSLRARRQARPLRFEFNLSVKGCATSMNFTVDGTEVATEDALREADRRGGSSRVR